MNPLQKLLATQKRMEIATFNSPYPWNGKRERRVKKWCREFNRRVHYILKRKRGYQ